MSLWGKTDDANSVPKFLTDANNATPQTSSDYAYFVDIEESQEPANRQRGIKTPGWNLYREYGTGRVSVEPLVAMKVAAIDAGDSDGNTIVDGD